MAGRPRRGSAYITLEGARALQEELEHLWRVERPEVTRQVSDAAALGDRSENAEYIYGKKRLREIDRRLRYLQKRLDEVQVVHRQGPEPDGVYFGAWVDLEESDGGEQRVRIVGPDEIDPERGWISIDSPVARSLLGKRAGDEVRARTPEGERELTIAAVHYEPPEGSPGNSPERR
ncbi:transcription elongation factor GreB [Thiohalospira halophila DSM 15071]|uniref:Transcription elongation factor GreB n=1 Tax=Thiohalospira halophila DSM 15071 TaxID=1123397 RepID=A0A1I1SP95_9GAMM|nr:transcription elongation factor GreB [Thiohalospira halophila]SFD48181.1 transcription elongation factor GreB [Thiohalospira halophila DSM 15071]